MHGNRQEDHHIENGGDAGADGLHGVRKSDGVKCANTTIPTRFGDVSVFIVFGKFFEPRFFEPEDYRVR